MTIFMFICRKLIRDGYMHRPPQLRQERGKPAVGEQREPSSHLRAEGERARERE